MYRAFTRVGLLATFDSPTYNKAVSNQTATKSHEHSKKKQMKMGQLANVT